MNEWVRGGVVGEVREVVGGRIINVFLCYFKCFGCILREDRSEGVFRVEI